ncbi:hypothetical protein EV363DRAFT_1183475 [Boletus edulis]|nr:hypothetical protein EV363DRAFT_1183475 [Boletus edulis]
MEDEHEKGDEKFFPRFAQEFSQNAAAEVLGVDATPFERMKQHQEELGEGAYAPFADREEWELAQWLIKNSNQRATEQFLKLPITRNRTQPSYRSNYTFLKRIDKLPTGPEWSCKLIRVQGDVGPIENHAVDEPVEGDSEELELWMRDPVACIQELIGNPAFDGNMAYAPEKVYVDREGQTRRYDEMWTGEWWWKTQERLPDGATVAPVILASDKTELSRFKGDKTAWPVYLTIGNLSKNVRREPSRHASVLLGYLPVSKLASFENNSVAGYRLFHYCMKLLLQPLVDAGRNGVDMVCADGYIRRVFPILAAFVGDHPEQCLVACCAENRCPKCLVPPNQRGANVQFPLRNQTQTCQTLHAQGMDQYPPEFIAEGLRPVFSPFWAELPYTDIFICISSDILHQLHQGLIKDHLKKWISMLADTTDLDARFRAMPIFPGLRHFKNGISTVKQWTATDHKQVERVFIGALVGAVVEPRVIQAARSLIDFTYLAQYHSHTDQTLLVLQQALDDFHHNKDVFIDLGCRNHFNFPKFHSLVHYTDTIRNLGSLDGLNTETSERLHIDFAKKAYAATSRKDYTIQMTRWLQRQEAVIWFGAYLCWRHKTELTHLEPSGSESDESIAGNAVPHCRRLGADSDHPSNVYRVSQQPQFPKKPLQQLEQHHGAVCFLEALKVFINTLPHGCQRFEPNVHDRFDVYSNLVLFLPPMEHAANKHARIRSHPQRYNGVRKPPTLARYDTVLVEVDRDLRPLGGLHGLRVAEVRVIFRLPTHLGNYPHPLAYIHWFKPLQTFDDNVKMFCVSRSTRQRRPHAEIIPVDRIVQHCHLIPRFPRGAVHPHWIRGRALSEAQHFYLNRHIDFRIFEQYRLH